MRAVKYLVLCFYLVNPQTSSAQGESSKNTFYLPAGVYPAVEVFGGASKGITYRDGIYKSAKRAARAGNVGDPLGDVGVMNDLGVNFRYILGSGFDFSISFFHQQSPKRETVFRYDYSVIDPDVKPPQYVDDYIWYKVSNVDTKVRLGFEPMPVFYFTPYVSAGIGVNYTEVNARNYIPGKKTKLSFFYPGNTVLGHFSFDWALYAGLRINLTDNVYVFGEFFYDEPFSNHYFFEYKLETRSRGVHGGLGVRFK